LSIEEGAADELPIEPADRRDVSESCRSRRGTDDGREPEAMLDVDRCADWLVR
jgi:hypothetical protein